MNDELRSIEREIEAHEREEEEERQDEINMGVDEEEIIEKKETKQLADNERYKCNKCKDKIGAVICPCEVAPKYDLDYEEWRNK